MATLNQDLSLYQGEARQVTVVVTDSGGSPLDMTLLTCRYRMAKGPDPSRQRGVTILNAAISKEDIDGTGDGARFTLDLSANDLEAGQYDHELRVTDDVVMKGAVTVLSALT